MLVHSRLDSRNQPLQAWFAGTDDELKALCAQINNFQPWDLFGNEE
jgi:hypothetical protein